MDFQCEYYCTEYTERFPQCDARKAEGTCWLTYRDVAENEEGKKLEQCEHGYFSHYHPEEEGEKQ